MEYAKLGKSNTSKVFSERVKWPLDDEAMGKLNDIFDINKGRHFATTKKPLKLTPGRQLRKDTYAA